MALPQRFQSTYGQSSSNSQASDMVPLLRRLRALTALTDSDAALVTDLVNRPVRDVAPRSDIHREGDSLPPMAILSGWACRQRLLPDGRRQIISFLLPGDIVGVMAPCLPAPCAAVALTRVRMVDVTPLYQAAAAQGLEAPGLGQGLRVMHLLDEALLRDQITRLGRQTAYERFGNLLLELYHRLQTVGLAADGQFAFPLTQEMLADALGLSVVHVNRTVQQMRRDGLLELRSGAVAMPRLDALRAVADWEPHRTSLRQVCSNGSGTKRES